MKMIPIILAAASGFVAAMQPAAAAEDLKRGEALLTRACGACHAIGRGDSPVKDAPAFRTLGQRYPVESLEEALGEGLNGRPPRHAGIQV